MKFIDALLIARADEQMAEVKDIRGHGGNRPLRVTGRPCKTEGCDGMVARYSRSGLCARCNHGVRPRKPR